MDDYAKGCLLGLACGDAAGAVLEPKSRATPERVQAAMRMPGGRAAGPGQLTGSGETMLALLASIQGRYSQDAAAQEYSRWYLSSPAGMEASTRRAFEKETPKSASEMMTDAAKFNRNSRANGALMRVAPLAVLGARSHAPIAQVAYDARQDALLSHPHPVCQDANVAFVVALMHLLTRRGDVSGAHKAAVKAIGDPDVLRWINDAVSGVDPGPAAQHAGHVGHALSLAFYHLGKRSRFADAVFDVLCRGADAAIVGAMIGALWGVRDIPAYMLDPVLKFDCTAVRRPAKYCVRLAIS